MCLTLGTWHPYKQANVLVWQHFAQRWLGPLVNYIDPGSNFSKKSKLHTISTWLTYIRIAYPLFKDQLESAIVTASDNYFQGKPFVLKYLKELHQLVEFFIPTVRFQ